jgi:carboxyl-terminal processing protease
MLRGVSRPVLYGVSSALLLVVGFFGGALFASKNAYVFAQGSSQAPENVDLAPFWRLWNELDARFVPADEEQAFTTEEHIYGAMQGLAGSYGDPYTVYLPPVEAEQFAEDLAGNFEGVGMEIALRDGILTVVAPLKGTPAYRAGIRPGDLILKIDGDPTDGLSVDEAVKKIRGPRGTAVNLTLFRDEEIVEIPVIRDVINIPTIDTEIVGDVFVIHLYNFSANAPNEFRAALREFGDSGLGNLVLDLRGNPGGYLEAAVDMASFFLPAGAIVVTEDFGGKRDPRHHRSYGYNVFRGLDMVILIDRGSASASEILAGALSQHGVATLVGSKSFGKGSVQELVPITGDSSLKVTVAHWKTPDGTSISKNGLVPDEEVTDKDIRDDIDEVLNKALEILQAR